MYLILYIIKLLIIIKKNFKHIGKKEEKNQKEQKEQRLLHKEREEFKMQDSNKTRLMKNK